MSIATFGLAFGKGCSGPFEFDLDTPHGNANGFARYESTIDASTI
eukprot:CAMPEP_0172462694 /NCGR_PEP_ID=MMETSP1065-20121228/44607_1 /TAXON_ID=265537 /ORGANISM="Amphiprora paludosa, Strain CCMP125" /LENGTH=44 /DNA_ID= /DNA_START= /DNA_END= /DNA_ORIENTATION=